MKDWCDNAILSAGFSSTNHVDCGDKLDEAWKENLVSELEKVKDCDEGTLEKKLYNYFQTYLRTLDGSVYKSTTCGFTSVTCGGTGSTNSTDKSVATKSYYKQWFVCNRLGIAHNISSNQLEDELFAGVYGNSFISGFEPHATSIPVYVDSEGRVHLKELEGVPMPVAWGR